MPRGRATNIRRLTNSTGGGDIDHRVGGRNHAAYNEATLAAQLATIVNKINHLIEALAHPPR